MSLKALATAILARNAPRNRGATEVQKDATRSLQKNPQLLREVACSLVADPPSPEPFDRDNFEERAAIMEFDGGLPRAEAELLAWEHIQASMQRLSALEWLARYSPERLPQGCRREHFPVANLQPGPRFWEERERRVRRV